MPRSERARLDDILAAAERIADFTSGMTLKEFGEDLRTVHAVLHNLTLIGEAAKGISEAVRSAAPEIPWSEMAGMRSTPLPSELWGRGRLLEVAKGTALFADQGRLVSVKLSAGRPDGTLVGSATEK